MTLIALMLLAADPLAEPLPEVVLLDFTASYCGPCKQMVPILQEMEENRYPIRRIDITEHPNIARKFGIDRIPAFVLLVNGQEKKRVVGMTSKAQLTTMMKAARDKLVASRRREEQARQAQQEAVAQARQPTGLRGIFSRIRQGFTGQPQTTGFQHPTFRAQSPEASLLGRAGDAAMAATVRIHVSRPDGNEDVGTGSVIYSVTGETLILTCAHLFFGSGKSATIQINTFHGDEQMTWPAQLLGTGGGDSDVALLKLTSQKPLPSVQIAPLDQSINAGQDAFSIGCNRGRAPSHMPVKVVDIDRYQGASNIVCTVDPVLGRSGGGLFNADGDLIGVCSCADHDAHEGLYMARGPVMALLKATDCLYALEAPQDAPPAAAESGFDAQEELIATLFEDNTVASSAPDFEPQDSFQAGSAPPVTASGPAAPAADAAQSPVEITVIVTPRDRSQPREMVVISNPSPWLRELLTGTSGTATAAANTHTVGRTASGEASTGRAQPLPRARRKTSETTMAASRF